MRASATRCCASSGRADEFLASPKAPSQRIAQASGGTREQVLAKAIAMIESAVKARNAGKHVGVATDDTQLEHRYRRLLACYPRAFRHEHEQEILSVLMAGAGDGQQRPRPGEAADLIRSAIWIRLRPSVPRSARTVRAAVRLMYAGAAVTTLSLIIPIISLAFIGGGAARLRLLGRS